MLGFLKEKSAGLLETYKHDLAEFAQQVKADTSTLLPPAPKGTSGAASAPPPTTPLDADWAGKAATYVEPLSRAEQAAFDGWVADFSLAEYAEAMEEVCRDQPAVSTLRDALVPAKVTAEGFWARYFYFEHKAYKEEQKQKILKRLTHSQEEDEEEFTWGGDEEDEPTAPARPTGPTTGAATGAEAELCRALEELQRRNAQLEAELSALKAAAAATSTALEPPSSSDAEGEVPRLRAELAEARAELAAQQRVAVEADAQRQTLQAAVAKAEARAAEAEACERSNNHADPDLAAQVAALERELAEERARAAAALAAARQELQDTVAGVTNMYE
eukprot:EG_transcript_18437